IVGAVSAAWAAVWAAVWSRWDGGSAPRRRTERPRQAGSRLRNGMLRRFAWAVWAAQETLDGQYRGQAYCQRLPAGTAPTDTLPGWMLPDAAMPMPPISIAPRSVMMSPNRLVVTATSNHSGFLIIHMQAASM